MLPALYKQDYLAALTPLLLFSVFRYLALVFMVPSFTTGLEATPFATRAALGDLTVAGLALIAAFATRYKTRFGVPMTWIYAIAGSLDFIYAFSLAGQSNLASNAGSVWVILSIFGPAWMITLVLLFIVLLKHPAKA